MSRFVLPGSVPMHWDPPPLSRGDWRDWQAELFRIAPRSDHLSWLLLHWVPGDPWSPVHRWIIYQMVPRAFIPPIVLEDLEGPNPRWFGHWDRVKQDFIQTKNGSPTSFSIDSLQWTLYRKYACHARPLWVIQGPNGGHRRRFDHWEKAVIQMQTGVQDAEPAAPGDLPYAEPDERVIAKLGELDRVRRYKYALDFCERNPEQVEAADQAELQRVREWLWGWLETQIDNVVQETPSTAWKRAVGEMWDGAREVGPDADPQMKLEQLHERFITED